MDLLSNLTSLRRHTVEFSGRFQVIAVVEGKILAIKAMMASFGIPIEFDKVSHVMREKNTKCAAHSDIFFSH